MVQALMGEEENFKARVQKFKEMQDDESPQENGMVGTDMGSMSLDDRVRTTASKPPTYQPIERQQSGSEDVIISPRGHDGDDVDPSKQAGKFRFRFLS